MQAGVAQNGSQALEMVSQQRPDLILLDLMMPEFSGAQVLAELQRDPDTSSIPVIVISAFARTEEAINQQAMTLAQRFRLPLLATNGVRYAQPHQREILDVFTCIRNHRTLDTAGRLLAKNSDRYLKLPRRWKSFFTMYPRRSPTRSSFPGGFNSR